MSILNRSDVLEIKCSDFKSRLYIFEINERFGHFTGHMGTADYVLSDNGKWVL